MEEKAAFNLASVCGVTRLHAAKRVASLAAPGVRMCSAIVSRGTAASSDAFGDRRNCVSYFSAVAKRWPCRLFGSRPLW